MFVQIGRDTDTGRILVLAFDGGGLEKLKEAKDLEEAQNIRKAWEREDDKLQERRSKEG